jgi:hypothetical protein
MDWKCTLTEERLSDYLEGQLAATDSAALEAHAKTCASCAQLVARVGGLVDRMHGLEPLEAPAFLHAKIMEATLGVRPSPEGPRRWFAWVPMLWQPRFAMGIATVAACCVVVVQAGGVTPGKLRRADLNPVDMLRAVNRQAHLTYARSVKFVNNFRVVFEIQSRLEPGPPQEQAPARKQHDAKPHSNYPQQKSETHPGRSEATNEVQFAQELRPNTPGQILKRDVLGFLRGFDTETLTPVALLVADDLTRSPR